MQLSKLVVYFASGFFLLYGIAFSMFPNLMAGLITGGAIHGTSALVDFRATYGGMTIAVGLTILYLYRLKLIQVLNRSRGIPFE